MKKVCVFVLCMFGFSGVAFSGSETMEVKLSDRKIENARANIEGVISKCKKFEHKDVLGDITGMGGVGTLITSVGSTGVSIAGAINSGGMMKLSDDIKDYDSATAKVSDDDEDTKLAKLKGKQKTGNILSGVSAGLNATGIVLSSVSLGKLKDLAEEVDACKAALDELEFD